MNQAFLALLSLSLLLFTDHVYTRRLQFEFGYLYSMALEFYAVFGISIVFVYGFSEPLMRLYRLRWLRLEQVRLAIELRETLIREARERKEARKDKRIKSFEQWTVNFGHNSMGTTGYADDQDNTETKQPQDGTETKTVAQLVLGQVVRRNRTKKVRLNILMNTAQTTQDQLDLEVIPEEN